MFSAWQYTSCKILEEGFIFCEKATAIATEHPTDGFAFLGKSESVHNDKKSNTEWCWTFCGVFELNVH